ncbi:hypothetical protein OC834_001601 [Tilletia horrida]|uniref:Uncharacterized protein n=1 Tax=Tilletia horrida TaxID=155126 RepID=A0AAN6JKR4_9BASI|nr:hypothetical protein OC842_003444 [Tilletia horrida]KAK0535259.1 hypothetical protein OC834_001601 [Tilletia horrida]
MQLYLLLALAFLLKALAALAAPLVILGRGDPISSDLSALQSRGSGASEAELLEKLVKGTPESSLQTFKSQASEIMEMLLKPSSSGKMAAEDLAALNAKLSKAKQTVGAVENSAIRAAKLAGSGSKNARPSQYTGEVTKVSSAPYTGKITKISSDAYPHRNGAPSSAEGPASSSST